MKLSAERFLSSITYLCCYYPNFKFEVKDKSDEKKVSYQFNVWYDVFKEFEEELFVKVIETYCRENVYAPQSPSQILEFMREKMITHSKSGEKAWEIVYGEKGVIKECGFNIDKSVSKLLEMNEKVIAETVSEMKSEFTNLLTEQLPYVKRNFIKVYQEVLKKYVYKKVSQSQLSFNENKMIGEK
jgi:hypothetical protein